MGFIELEKLPIKERQVINVFNACTFLLKGKRYYFKELKNTNRCYNELVGYELAKDFGMEAVPYDIASYDGFIGYLSEDYMKPGYSCLDDLYDKYFEHDTRNRCNLDDVSMFLRDTYPEFAENIIHDLEDLLMFDIIIGNYDRHDGNIVIDTINGRLAPVSDNEMMLEDDAMYGQFYSFRMNANDKTTLDSFLAYLDSEGLMRFARKALIISDKNMESVIQRVEKKIGYPMIESLKKEITKKFSDYFSFLLRKINKELESRQRLVKSR